MTVKSFVRPEQWQNKNTNPVTTPSTPVSSPTVANVNLESTTTTTTKSVVEDVLQVTLPPEAPQVATAATSLVKAVLTLLVDRMDVACDYPMSYQFAFVKMGGSERIVSTKSMIAHRRLVTTVAHVSRKITPFNATAEIITTDSFVRVMAIRVSRVDAEMEALVLKSTER